MTRSSWKSTRVKPRTSPRRLSAPCAPPAKSIYRLCPLRSRFRLRASGQNSHRNQLLDRFFPNLPRIQLVNTPVRGLSYNSPADATNTMNTENISVKHDPMDIADLKAELERLHSSSFGWALSCCRRDFGEAEEVLQNVYLKIIEGKARFRGEASFKTWLVSVIRKTAVSEHRKGLLRKMK